MCQVSINSASCQHDVWSIETKQEFIINWIKLDENSSSFKKMQRIRSTQKHSEAFPHSRSSENVSWTKSYIDYLYR